MDLRQFSLEKGKKIRQFWSRIGFNQFSTEQGSLPGVIIETETQK